MEMSEVAGETIEKNHFLQMDTLIEIGTEEQKELIKTELSIIELTLNEAGYPFKIKQVIIPEDFDSKVKELLGSEVPYESARDTQVAVAKFLKLGMENTIVFSPVLVYCPI